MMQNLLELHLRIMLKTTDDILRNSQLLTMSLYCTVQYYILYNASVSLHPCLNHFSSGVGWWCMAVSNYYPGNWRVFFEYMEMIPYSVVVINVKEMGRIYSSYVGN